TCALPIFLGNNNRILEVVTLPRHVSHQQVPSKGKLTIIGCITLNERLTFGDAITFSYQWCVVDTGVLVGSSELHQAVCFYFIIKVYGALFFRNIVLDDNFSCIYKLHHTVTFSGNQRAGIQSDAAFQTGSNYWRFGAHQRYGLALHVGTHQSTVSIIVL